MKHRKIFGILLRGTASELYRIEYRRNPQEQGNSRFSFGSQFLLSCAKISSYKQCTGEREAKQKQEKGGHVGRGNHGHRNRINCERTRRNKKRKREKEGEREREKKKAFSDLRTKGKQIPFACANKDVTFESLILS